jgi:hypothetical protein
VVTSRMFGCRGHPGRLLVWCLFAVICAQFAGVQEPFRADASEQLDEGGQRRYPKRTG